ncbi:MAG: hypothetical protein M3134_10115 [Actinomycetota bacterium]|nr:hypothetical protein [Actinomycetota bacterium]
MAARGRPRRAQRPPPFSHAAGKDDDAPHDADVLETFDRVQALVERSYARPPDDQRGAELLRDLVEAEVRYAKRRAGVDVAQRGANVLATCAGAGGVVVGAAIAAEKAGLF